MTIQTMTGRAAQRFILLCTAVYFTSYLTRINYGAIITELVASTDITREQAGAVSTALFFTYGLGQLISGFIGDRIPPRRLIVIGMLSTAVCNLLMPVFPEPGVMIALWALNGFSQALFWPPLVRMMATHLSADDYNRACVSVSAGSAVATMVIYILAPACILLAGWRLVFFVGAAAAVLMVILWLTTAPKDEGITPADEKAASPAPAANAPSLWRDGFVVGMIAWLGLAIVLQGILRDGVTTWMPTLVSDTFDLPSSVSILTGIVLPIFSMISYQATTKLNDRVGNIVTTSALLFGLGAAAAALLLALFGVSPIASVLLMAVITGCMHGVNLMLITRIPAYFGRYNKISTISGILNAFTYVGSAASTYGFAVLSEAFGWHFTVGSWLVIAAAGTAVCAVGVLMWKKFLRRGEM